MADKEIFDIRNSGIMGAFWLPLAVGAALRLWGIRYRPIWYDEAFSLLEAKLDLEMILRSILGRDPSGTIADQHPPGYFFGLFGWARVAGVSVVSGRLFSVLLGALTLIVVFLIAREVLGIRLAWVPVLVLAVSPFHIHYSQEIRMYSLMAFMLALAVYAMLKGMRSENWGWWVLFAVSSAAAQYAQHLASVFLICLALVPLFRGDWRNVKRTLVGGLGAIALYSPWLVNLPAQISSTGDYWVQKPTVSRFLTLILAYFSGLPIPDKLVVVILTIGLVGLILLSVASIRIWKSRTAGESQPGLWAAYLALTPPIVLWLISQVRPVYIERALLASVVFFAVWAGWVVGHPRTKALERWVLVGVLAAGSVVGIHTHLTYSGFPYADYEGLGDWLVERVERDEVVVHSNKLSFLPMHYFYGETLPMAFIADPKGSGTDTLRIPTQEVFGINESGSIGEAVGSAEGIWLVIFDQALKEAGANGLEQQVDLAWLEKEYTLIERLDFGDLWIYHFSGG